MTMTLALEKLRKEAEKAVRDVGIPPRPSILTRLVRDLRAEEPDVSAIGQLIGSDVGLAAAIVKTVNSPAFGLAVRATSVKHALTLMGLRNAGNLVTGLLLKQAFPVSRHPLMERFWETSSRVAEVAAQLARALRCADADAAHTLGLFRDCGMAVLLGSHADYPDVLKSSAAPDGMRLTDAENLRWGINHAVVGEVLARDWMLPRAISDAVLHHHSLDAHRGRRGDLKPETMRLVAVTTLADYATTTVDGESVSRELELASDFAASQLGLGAAGKRQVVEFASPEPIAA